MFPPNAPPPNAPKVQASDKSAPATPMTNPSYGCGCALTHVYADLMLLYLLLSGIHRNVDGANFYSLHLMFAGLYEQTEADPDRIGEHIRGDYYLKLPMAPATLQQFSCMQFPPDDACACDLIDAAIAAHQHLNQSHLTALAQHEDAAIGNRGTIAVLESLAENCARRLYLLKSHQH
jgi:DNA-binding ferritin-like protein